MTPTELKGIAIIGMAGRFPGAANVEEYWRNLVEGVESISRFTEDELAASGLDVEALKKDPSFVPCRGVLPGVENFDAGFFNMTANEAAVTDPQQRVFLETAWEAMESAGYDPESVEGLVGVYGGLGGMTYYLNHLYARPEVTELVGERMLSLGNDKDYLATRVAYKLNLKGPALNINTACSTSLVTVCQACQELLTYQCDLALAGGVSLTFPQKGGVRYQEGGVFSPDGHCRPFDAKAQGTVSADGVGIVLLKRLSEAVADGDKIYAVIKGFGRNNDGSAKVGFSAPSVDGQAEAIATAQAAAGIEPDTISYVEAHGTGTPLGDPIEIAALTQAFRLGTDAKNFCGIGSVKGNFGHLNSAAGIASLIKTALAFTHEKLPPSLNFSEPNPKIDFADSPFYVNTKLIDWKRTSAPRRAGVSAFGLGGTNAHVVLEEAPVSESSGPSRSEQLLVFSARSTAAVEEAATNFVAHLKANPDVNLADAAYTLKVGRRAFPNRRIVACRDAADAIATLEGRDTRRVITQKAEAKEPAVVFMFPGQGTQYVNMGAELYRCEPVFKEELDRCADLLLPHLNLDLRHVLYPASEKAQLAETLLTETGVTQPAMFSIEYALAKLWMSWGIKPQAMIGHSIGEYVAACLAGVFTLEEAVRVVAGRARLIQALPPGSMLAVRLSESELVPLLPKDLTIAGINSPALCVVSGPTWAVKEFEAELKVKGIAGRVLETSHAFHSSMMDAAVEPLTRLLEKVNLKSPTIPYLSNLTGKWITPAEARSPAYWASHMRQSVRFADGLAELLKNPDVVLLEVGPGRGLGAFANQQPARNANRPALASFSAVREKELAGMLTALGGLWAMGKPIDWLTFYERENRRRVPLPTYPFQRQRYWIEPAAKPASRVAASEAGSVAVASPKPLAAQHERPEMETTFAAPTSDSERTLAGMWKELFNLREIGLDDDFFTLGGDSLLAMQLITRLEKRLGFRLTVPVFFQNSTVRKLAALYDREKPAQTGSALAPIAAPAERTVAMPAALAISASEPAPELVAFQEKGNRPPLFFLHGDWAGGGIYCGRLSRRLGEEQPLYALPPYRSGKAEVLNWDGMVNHHLRVIQAHTPHGPYLIGGYCVGAKVAVEVARKLVEQGEDVRHLFLIDLPQRYVPWLREMWPYVDKLGDRMSWSLLQKIRFLDRYPIALTRWFRRSNASKLAPLLRRLGLAKYGNNPVAMGFEVNEFNAEVLDSLDYALYFLASCLHDVAPLAIPATLYFSEESFPESFRRQRSMETFRDFTLDMVPGNHHTCITTYVNVMAERMEQTLNQLFPPGGGAPPANRAASQPASGELTKAL